jgi:hypothetical protein
LSGLIFSVVSRKTLAFFFLVFLLFFMQSRAFTTWPCIYGTAGIETAARSMATAARSFFTLTWKNLMITLCVWLWILIELVHTYRYIYIYIWSKVSLIRCDVRFLSSCLVGCQGRSRVSWSREKKKKKKNEREEKKEELK